MCRAISRLASCAARDMSRLISSLFRIAPCLATAGTVLRMLMALIRPLSHRQPCTATRLQFQLQASLHAQAQQP